MIKYCLEIKNTLWYRKYASDMVIISVKADIITEYFFSPYIVPSLKVRLNIGKM